MTWRLLAAANLKAVDRAARHFAGARQTGCEQIADEVFWNTMHGPVFDHPDGKGFFDWGMDAYDDC